VSRGLLSWAARHRLWPGVAGGRDTRHGAGALGTGSWPWNSGFPAS